MTTTSSIEDLGRRIEQVVQDHIAASQKTAAAAVVRAFASASGKVSRSSRASGPRQVGRRRPPAEIAALADRLYEVIRVTPGETMAVLAPHVGESPRALLRPMTHLKRSGRVRSVGQKSLTRYFPLAATESA